MPCCVFWTIIVKLVGTLYPLIEKPSTTSIYIWPKFDCIGGEGVPFTNIVELYCLVLVASGIVSRTISTEGAHLST